jgi:hypothetical protein
MKNQVQNYPQGAAKIADEPVLAADEVKKYKLSAAQIKVIIKLKKGEIIHYVDGLNSKCFYHDSMKTINWNTIFKLEQLDLIVREYRRIALTDMGRSICS